ncbi:MAG: heparan-alpha-glucosaminide N-acetyltransferase [Negativicutes bacterium]
MTNSPFRIWEIDFFRGCAILLMIVFHLVFDLAAFWGYSLNYMDGFWYYEGKLSAILFMIISGVSSALSVHSFRRGLVVFACGLIITLVTYFFDSQTYIRFGILHMLGSCMLLFPFIKKLNSGWLLVAGTIAIAAGRWTRQLALPSSLLLPFGVTPLDFTSLDYYPLLPWSGFFLYGAGLGQLLYRKRLSLLHQPQPFWLQPLTALGRHSLAVYLLHQPVLLSILYLWHCFNTK